MDALDGAPFCDQCTPGGFSCDPGGDTSTGNPLNVSWLSMAPLKLSDSPRVVVNVVPERSACGIGGLLRGSTCLSRS